MISIISIDKNRAKNFAQMEKVVFEISQRLKNLNQTEEINARRGETN